MDKVSFDILIRWRHWNPEYKSWSPSHVSAYMFREIKKKGSEEPSGRTGIKTQTQRMYLRTRGGGSVSWDEVRE